MAFDGKKVLVTRARDQSAEFVQALEDVGASVVAIPYTRIRVLPVSWPEFHLFDLIILSSKNVVDAFLKAGGEATDVQIACVGSKTARYLKAAAPKLDPLIPDAYHGEGLIQCLREQYENFANLKVLCPQAVQARGKHVDLLTAAGALVECLDVYSIDKLAAPVAPSEEIDYVTFLSGRGVEAFLESVPNALEFLSLRRVVVIGPVAAQKAKELKVRVDVVPQRATFEDMIEAMQRDSDTGDKSE